jgi:hypothetical protein
MTNLIEKELDELYKKVKKGEALGRPRRLFAYCLKLVAGGAGLAIATGKLASIDQELGIAVLVVVFLDSVFSNHVRLMAETQAGHTYAALGRRIKATYNRDLDSVVKRIKAGDTNAEEELDQMKRNAHIELTNGIEEIETKLAEVDITALKALSLEEERKLKGH